MSVGTVFTILTFVIAIIAKVSQASKSAKKPNVQRPAPSKPVVREWEVPENHANDQISRDEEEELLSDEQEVVSPYGYNGHKYIEQPAEAPNKSWGQSRSMDYTPMSNGLPEEGMCALDEDEPGTLQNTKSEDVTFSCNNDKQIQLNAEEMRRAVIYQTLLQRPQI